MAEEKEEKEKKEEKEEKKETAKKIEPKKEAKKEEKVPEKKKPEEKPEETEQEEEIEVPAEFKDFVEKIEKMNILDLSKLVKILEKRFHVSAAPVISAQPVAGGGAPAAGEEEEEKSSYNVVLTGAGDQKIPVIKVVRDVTGKGLKEAKDVVDQADKEPQVLKEGAKKEEAEEMKKKLEEVGARVELK